MELNSALKPVRLVSNVMGINVEGRLGRAYTLLVFVTVTLLLYASFLYLSIDRAEILTGVDSIIIWTHFGTDALFVTIVLGCCLIRPRQFLFPIEDMERVDFVLRSFGVKIANEYLRRTQLLQIFLILLIPNTVNASRISEAIGGKYLALLHWLHYSYALTLSIITDCLFADYLMLIRDRFYRLNQLLKLLVRRNFKPSSFELSMIYVIEKNGLRIRNHRDFSDLDKLGILHHDICCISKKVNRSFGLQQLVSIAISLVMTTGQLYEAYHFLMSDVNPAQIAFTKIMWMMCYVGRLFYVTYACSGASHEASLTSSIIHEIPLQLVSNSVRLQIQHFSLQLLHDNLKFNACGFFDIDFSLLCSIVGVVSTYLVILIQMDRKTQCTNSMSYGDNSSVLNE